MAKKPMNWTKAAIGAATAGAMLSATPALARDRYDHRDRDGIGAGEIIAGAVVLGGLAAILSARCQPLWPYRRDAGHEHRPQARWLSRQGPRRRQRRLARTLGSRRFL